MKKHSIIEQVDGINDKESDMKPISDTLEFNEVNMAKKDSTTSTPVPPPPNPLNNNDLFIKIFQEAIAPMQEKVFTLAAIVESMRN